MEPTTTVPVKSAWFSKINWAEALKIVAGIGAATGMFTLDVETQNHILMAIIGIGGVATWVMRTWFTKSVTTAAAK